MFSVSTRQRNSGFTLLELVLVLFILIIITSTSLSFIENEDGQIRFEESFQKLETIQEAFINVRESRGSAFISGFIVDNGALPNSTNMDAITSDGTDWSDDSGDEWRIYNEYLPYYYDIDNNENQLLDDDRFYLGKGFRGPYVKDSLDADGDIKDGWGVDFIVTTASIAQHSFTFNASSQITEEPFNVDETEVEISINENDWSILPSSLNISVTNNDIDVMTDQNLRLGLVVFSNNAVNTSGTEDDDLWRMFYFDFTLSDGDTINSSSESWLNDGTEPSISRIPIGEHLVLLLNRDVAAGSAAEIVDVARLTIFPSTNIQPEVTLEYPAP